ncbi:MAG: tail fiber domain-containing protein [Bacteroidales bacterium]
MKLRFIFLFFVGLYWHLNNFSQIRMSANGYVGIGNLYGAQPRRVLDVNGEAYFSCIPSTSGIYFANYHNYWNNKWYDEPIILPQWGNSAWLGNSNIPFWRVYTNQIWTADGIVHQSDRRLKKDIQPLQTGLEKIKKMRPVTYNLILDSMLLPDSKREKYDKKRLQKIGLIAQEVAEVIPEAVVKDEGRNLYGIDYTVVIPVLVQAIKEQQLIIENLQNEIKELKSNSSKLKSAPISDGKTNSSSAPNDSEHILYQNVPNPFSQSTTIEYYLANDFQRATLNIYDMNGTQLKSITLHQKGYGNVTLNGYELKAGIYMYALIVDGQIIDTKKMVLTD